MPLPMLICFENGCLFALKMVELARKFASNSGGSVSVLDDKDEFDAVLKEMVETINETNGDKEKMNAMLHGWISMEDNEACVSKL